MEEEADATMLPVPPLKGNECTGMTQSLSEALCFMCLSVCVKYFIRILKRFRRAGSLQLIFQTVPTAYLGYHGNWKGPCVGHVLRARHNSKWFLTVI